MGAKWEDLSRKQKKTFENKKAFKEAKREVRNQGGDPTKVAQIERVDDGLHYTGVALPTGNGGNVQWKTLTPEQQASFDDKQDFKATKRETRAQGGDTTQLLHIQRVNEGLTPLEGKTEEGYYPSQVEPVPEVEHPTFYHGLRRPDYDQVTDRYEDWYTDNVGTAIKEALTRIEVDPTEYDRTGTGYGYSKAQKYDADSERLMAVLKKPITDQLSNMDSKFGHGFGMWQVDKKEFELPPKETRIQNPYRSDIELAAQQAGVKTRTTTKVVSDIKDKVSVETPDTSQYRDSGLSILGRSRIGGESDLRIKSVDEL